MTGPERKTLSRDGTITVTPEVINSRLEAQRRMLQRRQAEAKSASAKLEENGFTYAQILGCMYRAGKTGTIQKLKAGGS